MKMHGCARGVCTITGSPCYFATSSCRLGTGMRILSTADGSTRSTAYLAARSTSISDPTPCFLMGACGLRGSSGMTWTTPWRRLLTWCSPPCARRTCLLLQACLSHCTRSRTAPTWSERHAWTSAPRYRIKGVPRLGRVEFKAVAEIFSGPKVLCRHQGLAFKASISDDVANAA
jgi:hypothetical protein